MVLWGQVTWSQRKKIRHDWWWHVREMSVVHHVSCQVSSPSQFAWNRRIKITGVVSRTSRSLWLRGECSGLRIGPDRPLALKLEPKLTCSNQLAIPKLTRKGYTIVFCTLPCLCCSVQRPGPKFIKRPTWHSSELDLTKTSQMSYYGLWPIKQKKQTH